MNDPRADARRWLAAAQDDLDTARYLAAGGRYAPACLLAQQAAEKAIRAILYARGARSVLGHSVRGLIEQLEPRLSALDSLLDAARELDLLYVPARYPNGLQAGTPREAFSSTQAARAIESAASVVAAVGTAIPGAA